ncbi:MAG: hypothetical protein K0Q93_3026 [Nocardioidaceae bacterium]|nr:hypothetical protein [Nocardioidaceae bacterium]
MQVNELPVTEDFTLDDWANVISLYDAAPDSWQQHAEISQQVTAVITQEDKGAITLERIVSVEALRVIRGDYAETDVYALLKLTDGWGTVQAWCDTTGWDCRSGGQWKWAATREEAIANGLGKAERAALGLSLPHEVDGGAA